MCRKKSSNIMTLIKLENFTSFVSGLKCVKIKNEKLKYTGNLYKFFAVVISLIITAEFLKDSYTNVQRTLDVFNITVVLTFTFNELSILFTYLFMVVNTIFVKCGIRMKIYEALIEIDKELEFDDVDQNKKFKKNAILFYLIYISFKTFHCVYNSLMWPQFHIWFFHFCSIVIDFQTIHFILEINIIARRFEILRYNLERIAFKSMNLEIQDGLITSFWKDHHERKKMDCIKILSILNKLTNIIEDINYFYGSTVIFYKLFNYNIIFK